MVKNALFYLCLALLLAGCAGNDAVKQSANDSNRGYFADADQCRQSSASNENMRMGGTTVNIQLGFDQNVFIACMARAGRPVPQYKLTTQRISL